MNVEDFLNQLPAIVYRLDPLGRIQYINDEVSRYGYDPKVLVGKDILELVHPDDHSLIAHNLHERRSGNRATRNLRARFLARDTSTRILQVRSKPTVATPEENTEAVYVNLFSTGLYNKDGFEGTYGIAWDVTESVISEELLQKMLEDSPISMLVYDREGYIQHANAIAREKLALPTVSQQIPVTDLVEEHEREATWDRITRSLAGEESEPRTFLMKSLDGRELQLEVRARPLLLQGEHCVLLTMVDMGERDEFNQRLIDSEARYRSVFEHANDAIFLIRDYRFIECNKKTLTIFGINDLDDIIGKTPIDFSPSVQPDGRSSEVAAKQLIDAALTGVPQRFNWLHTRGNGSSFPAEIVLSRLVIEGEILVLAIVRDNSIIEQRFRLEEMVSRIAIEFISLPLNDASPWRETIKKAFEEVADLLKADSLILYNLDEKQGLLIPEYTYYNPEFDLPEALHKSYPLSEQEAAFAGLKDTEFPYVIYDDPKKSGKFFSKVLQAAELKSSVNVRLIVRNKWIGTLSIGWKKVRELDPEEVRTIQFLASAFASLLERRRVFEKENLLTQQLYQAQKMEEVGKLSSGVAHDFNNLLTVILGNTELLKRLVQESEEAYEQKLELLDNVSNAADLAANLTRQLLLFSRTAMANNQQLQLNTIVSSIQKMISRITPSSIVKEVYLADELPLVSVDPTHVQQIILNLSVNAVDAMPTGGSLTFTTSQNEFRGERECRLCKRPIHGRYVTLAICDTGSGMTSEVERNVFEPFFTTKDQGKGTGLGLATVANIVSEYSGGHLTMLSDLDKGTRFEIHFPVEHDAKATGETEAPTLSVAPLQLQGRVMLVEDNPHLNQLLRKVLENSGLAVESFDRATTAWKSLTGSNGTFDLVVTDQVMPDMSGIELARKLRDRKPGIPILIISGYAAETDFEAQLEELKIPLLPKPFSTTDFVEQIRELLTSN